MYYIQLSRFILDLIRYPRNNNYMCTHIDVYLNKYIL